MKLHDHHSTAKAVIAFLILFIALGVLLIFKMNAESVIQAGNFTFFMFIATAGMALLVGLLYLVNKPHSSGKRKK